MSTKKRAIKVLATVLCAVMCLTGMMTVLSGCKKEAEEGYIKNPELDTSKEVVLRIATGQETWPEMDKIITEFENIYPNCTIIYEYLEEFSKNIDTRLAQTEQKIDIIKTLNIQEGTTYKDYALNLISEDSQKILDLSGTNSGLVDNFRYTGAENTLYAVPFGGELRGMYVNTTLLAKYNLEVPKNRAEFLNCCEVLYDAGYIPIQADIGSCAQQLIYPYICNSIVNGGDYEKKYADIENIEAGISEYFRDAYSFLYDIVEKGYYDYKRVEEETKFTFNSKDIKAKDFLNIIETSGGEYEKKDDIGEIAFMTDSQSFGLNLEKAKSDYHSEINYEFIMSPVGEDGGYVYLSPAEGLAVNNQSDNIDWALEFLNYFFVPEVNEAFAEQSGKIPVTKDALLKFDIPAERTCDVGQMTFSYGFYKIVTTPLLGGYDDMVGISKMNAKKYMKDNGDGTYSLAYTLDDYLDRLESEFQKAKAEK